MGVSTCKRDPNDVIHTLVYKGFRVGPGYMHSLLVFLHVLNAQVMAIKFC